MVNIKDASLSLPQFFQALPDAIGAGGLRNGSLRSLLKTLQFAFLESGFDRYGVNQFDLRNPHLSEACRQLGSLLEGGHLHGSEPRLERIIRRWQSTESNMSLLGFPELFYYDQLNSHFSLPPRDQMLLGLKAAFDLNKIPFVHPAWYTFSPYAWHAHTFTKMVNYPPFKEWTAGHNKLRVADFGAGFYDHSSAIAMAYEDVLLRSSFEQIPDNFGKLKFAKFFKTFRTKSGLGPFALIDILKENGFPAVNPSELNLIRDVVKALGRAQKFYFHGRTGTCHEPKELLLLLLPGMRRGCLDVYDSVEQIEGDLKNPELGLLKSCYIFYGSPFTFEFNQRMRGEEEYLGRLRRGRNIKRERVEGAWFDDGVGLHYEGIPLSPSEIGKIHFYDLNFLRDVIPNDEYHLAVWCESHYFIPRPLQNVVLSRVISSVEVGGFILMDIDLSGNDCDELGIERAESMAFKDILFRKVSSRESVDVLAKLRVDG